VCTKQSYQLKVLRDGARAVQKGGSMDHEDDRIVDSGGISRRKMLRRIGAGAAIAWTAPVLTSMRAPAFAQGTIGCPGGGLPCQAPGDPCTGQVLCGNQGCFCNQNVTDGLPNGNYCCTVPTDCTNQDCRNNSDCPAGQVCQATCCPNPKCFVVCNADTAPGVGGTWKSAPR